MNCTPEQLQELLEPLRKASMPQLYDRNLLQQLLCGLGLNGEFPGDWPSHLQSFLGKGITLWQYPVQFADYLIMLSQLDLHSYLEIGVRDGGTLITTIEYLRRFGHIREAVGVDIVNDSPNLLSYRKLFPQAFFFQINSQSEEFGRFFRGTPFDLVLVDGQHEIEAMHKDFDNAWASGARAIACHDIWNYGMKDPCYEGWLRIKQRYHDRCIFVEFVGQYEEMAGRPNYPNLGIGLAIKRSD